MPMTRVKTIMLSIVLLVLAAVVVGALLSDRLMPKGTGAPSHALPVQADATEWDRVLTPMLAEHPGQTGTCLLYTSRCV